MKLLVVTVTIFSCLCGVVSAQSISDIDGTVSNGNTVTITGSSFGVKSQASPFLYENFEDGGLNDLLTESGATFALTTSGNRHVYSSRNVQGSNNGGMSINQNYDNTVFYTSAWFKWCDGFEWTEFNSQHKQIRIGVDGEDGNYPNATWIKDEFVLLEARDHVFNVERVPADTYANSDGNTTFWDDNEWHRVEGVLILSSGVGNSDGEFYYYLDGQLIDSATNIPTDNGTQNTMNGLWTISGSIIGLDGVILHDDVYYDKTQARVEIGNNATFSSCTYREIQIPTSWSADEIEVTVNQGELVTGQGYYLFVVDEDGTASTGYPITIGSSTATRTLNKYRISITSPFER